MKNGKLLFLLFISIFILSCSQQVSDSADVEKTDKAFLSLSVKDFSARTILPEKGKLSDYAYELYGTDASGIQHFLHHWENYDGMMFSKVDVQTGEWIFELHALKNSTVVLSGVSSSSIVIGENSVSFDLQELTYGNGNLYVTLYAPVGISKKVEAVLLDENGSVVNGFGVTSLTVRYDSAKGKNRTICQLNDIPKGYYLLRYFFYTGTASSNYVAVHNAFVRVEPSFTSTGIEEIASEESLYSVSLPIDHIEIASLPNKTIYYAEQALSLSGLKVNACYADGSRKEVTNYTTSIAEGVVLSKTDTKVTIAYGEFTKSFSITVTPNAISGIIVSAVCGTGHSRIVDLFRQFRHLYGKSGL